MEIAPPRLHIPNYSPRAGMSQRRRHVQGPHKDDTYSPASRDTWRPPSPPESVASFSSTVVPSDSISQIGWTPRKHHRHHNRHSDGYHRSSGSASPAEAEPYRRLQQEVQVTEEPASYPESYSDRHVEYISQPWSRTSRSNHSESTSHTSHTSRRSRRRSTSPSSRRSHLTYSKTEPLSVPSSATSYQSPSTRYSETTKAGSYLQTPTRSRASSHSPSRISRHSAHAPSAHLIGEEFEVVEVEVATDEDGKPYHIHRTHRYPVYNSPQ